MQSFHPTFSDRITQDGDGQYRWRYTLSPEQNRFYYRQMLVVCTIVGGIVTVIMAILLLSTIRWEDDWTVWLVVFAPGAGTVGLPALFGAFLMRGESVNTYEMDTEYIRQKHAAKGGDLWIRLSRITDIRREGDVFLLKTGFTTHRIYVPAEDAVFLEQYILLYNESS